MIIIRMSLHTYIEEYVLFDFRANLILVQKGQSIHTLVKKKEYEMT